MAKQTHRSQVNRQFPLIQQRLAQDFSLIVPTGTTVVPEWISLDLRGTDLSGEFTPVFGTAFYEVAYNTVPQSSGAALFLATTNTHFTKSINLGEQSELLPNGGFESGTWFGWGDFPEEWTLTTADTYTGNYAITDTHGGAIPTRVCFSDTIPVLPTKNYVVRLAYKATVTNSASFNVYVNWYDADKTFLSSSGNIVYVNSTVANWTKVSGIVTAPASAAYARIAVNIGSGTWGDVITAYLDDFSFRGQGPLYTPQSLLFAVRAVDSLGNVSPYSTWLQPRQGAKAIGASLADHVVSHQSLGFAPNAGVQITNRGLTTTGWDDPVEDWTYASATTFTVTGDVTARYQKGTKLRCKQGGGWLYFYVISSSYSAPNTTVTITGGSDYSLANAAITDNYYSYTENPQGFPDWFNYTPTWDGFSTPPSGGTARFSIHGRRCVVQINPGSSGTSNANNLACSLPVTSALQFTVAPCICMDNGSWLSALGNVSITGGNFICRPTVNGYWTTSGYKSVLFIAEYEI